MKKQRKNKNNGKSRFIVIGSLFIVFGVSIIGYHIYSNYKLDKISDDNIEQFFEEEKIIDNQPQEEQFVEVEKKEVSKTNYDYIAVIEIPKINVKRGLSQDKYYNNVNRNIEILKGSTMPDVSQGNFMVAGHSGTARTSYFRNLDKLVIGDLTYIYYNGIKYTYKVNNIYDIEKTGKATIRRDLNKTTLTMITCRHNTNKQIVVISELVNKETY